MAVPSAVAGLLRRPARLGDEVYSAIFGRIMSMDIAPGAKITVDAMARQLGVSPTPIREALTRLEGEGLVNKTHLIGYSVAPQLNAKQFADLCGMRLLLEPHAAARCAQIMPEAVIGQLEALGAQMDALAGAGGGVDAHAQFALLDMAFHDQIAVSADNELLVEALARLHSHVHLFRLLVHTHEASSAGHEHQLVLAAIKARDPQAAEAAMRAHIDGSRDRYRARYPGQG